MGVGVGMGGGIPGHYLVSTQLQLWFCCWGCGCYWAVTISVEKMMQNMFKANPVSFLTFEFPSDNTIFGVIPQTRQVTLSKSSPKPKYTISVSKL